MPDRASLYSFGQELQIDNVQYSDNGSYECQGLNDMSMTPTRRSFILSIECNAIIILSENNFIIISYCEVNEGFIFFRLHLHG